MSTSLTASSALLAVRDHTDFAEGLIREECSYGLTVLALSTSSRTGLSQAETASDKIVIVAELPRLDPDKVFDFWTTVDLLKKWWPPVAELESKLGGAYHFSWPKQNWAP
jgi:hypothetical protein